MISLAKLAVSAATAISLAVAPVPASADAEDVAKVLAGIAVLGIIAKAAENRNERRETKRSTVDDRSRYGRLGSIDDRPGTRIIDGDLRRYDEPRRGKVTGYKKNNPLPDRCLFVLDTDQRHDRLVYGQRCLNRTYKFAKKLPDHCRQVVRTNRNRQAVDGARCLARDGWRVARR